MAPTSPSHRRLRGVIVPIVTPFDADGNLDFESLEFLIEFLLSASVAAIFALGTGGEGPYLEFRERGEFVGRVVKAVDKRVPVLVGISDIGTDRAMRNLHQASEHGADGLVCTPPFYGEIGELELESHFRLLGEGAGGVPLYLYNIPSKVGYQVSVGSVRRLAGEGVIAGIKDSSGDLDFFRELRLNLGEQRDFSLLTGSDTFADAALLGLADGVIAGMANVDPAGYVALYRAGCEGRWGDAREEQDRLFRLREITLAGLPRLGEFSATISSFKAALVERGIIRTARLHAPLCCLNDAEWQRVREVLAAGGFGCAAAGDEK